MSLPSPNSVQFIFTPKQSFSNLTRKYKLTYGWIDLDILFNHKETNTWHPSIFGYHMATSSETRPLGFTSPRYTQQGMFPALVIFISN